MSALCGQLCLEHPPFLVLCQVWLGRGVCLVISILGKSPKAQPGALFEKRSVARRVI